MYSTLPYGNIAGRQERTLQQINLPPVSYTVTPPMMYSRFFKNNLMPLTNIGMEIWWFSSYSQYVYLPSIVSVV